MACRNTLRLDTIRPMRGVANIIIGVIFIIGGLTGHLVFIGTHSGGALAAVGAALVLLGLYRLTRG